MLLPLHLHLLPSSLAHRQMTCSLQKQSRRQPLHLHLLHPSLPLLLQVLPCLHLLPLPLILLGTGG